jgi:hypothetical protein
MMQSRAKPDITVQSLKNHQSSQNTAAHNLAAHVLYSTVGASKSLGDSQTQPPPVIIRCCSWHEQ